MFKDPDVIVGLNDWLFLKAGSNDSIDYYTGKKSLGRTCVSGWKSTLASRYKCFNEQDIIYKHLFIPNKETIYADFVGMELPNRHLHPIAEFISSLNAVERANFNQFYVDLIPFFSRLRDQCKLYWQTDSHWSYHGCYAAYQLLCSSLGVTPRKDLFDYPFSQGMALLDLGSKLSPPRREKVRFYEFLRDAKRIGCNDLVEYKETNGRENDGGLHVGSNVVFNNDSAVDQRTVVLFGDSFSECRTCFLTGMLAETFKEVHFVWNTAVDFDYAINAGADIVVSEIVERFMPKVPKDPLNLKEYTRKKLAAI